MVQKFKNGRRLAEYKNPPQNEPVIIQFKDGKGMERIMPEPVILSETPASVLDAFGDFKWAPVSAFRSVR